MRQAFRYLAVLAVIAVAIPLGGAIAQTWDGPPEYLGTITADNVTTKNESTTASSFPIPAGSYLKVSCDAAAYYAVAVSSATVTAANGLPIDVAPPAEYIRLKPAQASLAILGKSGTTNCKVHRLQ